MELTATCQHAKKKKKKTQQWLYLHLHWSVTFEEAEFLEESGDDEGVTEVKQQPTEQQALVVQVGGVWPRVDVAYRNLGR